MRKNIYLFLLAGLFTACGEDDLIRYSLEKDGLQFYTGEDSKLIPGDASDLDRIFNFATATYQERKKATNAKKPITMVTIWRRTHTRKSICRSRDSLLPMSALIS